MPWSVAVMQNDGLTNLASHDADFDRVPGTVLCAMLRPDARIRKRKIPCPGSYDVLSFSAWQ